MFTFVRNLAPQITKKAFSSKVASRQCPPINASSHKEGGYKIYKYMTFFFGLPAIAAVAALTFLQKKSRECEERPPFVPYESMRRRTKRFPWGDGNKSFFHNPIVNALPEGYEVEPECGDGGIVDDADCEEACDE